MLSALDYGLRGHYVLVQNRGEGCGEVVLSCHENWDKLCLHEPLGTSSDCYF